jgi:hypothetical protein
VSGMVAPCPVKPPLRFQRHNVSQQPALQLQLCLLCLSMQMVNALHELLDQGVHGPPSFCACSLVAPQSTLEGVPVAVL